MSTLWVRVVSFHLHLFNQWCELWKQLFLPVEPYSKLPLELKPKLGKIQCT